MQTAQFTDDVALPPTHRPLLRRLAPVPYLQGDDPRLADFRSLDLDTAEILAWANIPDTLFRRNRIQLLSSFPLLVPLLASNRLSELLTVAMEIGALVDRGDRLVESLAIVFGVGMSAVRYFCGRSAAQIGREWITNPFEVILAIETAPAQQRPQSAEEWEMFRRYWDYAGQNIPAFNHGPRTRARCYINEHLFASMCRLGYRTSSLNRLNRMTENRPECIRQSSDYFYFVHEWCSSKYPHEMQETADEPSYPALSELLLMRYPLAELIRQSICWHREIAQIPLSSQEFYALNGDISDSWPGLLRDPFAADDLTIVSLLCGDDLMLEGSTLQHCVGAYVETCLKGESHIVSIRDATGSSLSTAEIKLKSERSAWIPKVIQHYGMNNSQPSVSCCKALERVVQSLAETGNQQWISELQALHEERSELIATYLFESLQEQARIRGTLMRKILPDYDAACEWLNKAANAES